MAAGVGDEAGVGGVAEGTEHAGDVFEGRLFGATLAEGAGGLAFKVEDDVVAVGAENLAEMVVAMDADALAGRRGCKSFGVEGGGAGEEVETGAEDAGGGGDVGFSGGAGDAEVYG